MNQNVATEGPPASDLPLFYRSPRPLEPARHGVAGLQAKRSLRFAARTNSIPLGADEFYTAQGHYPIVFTAGKPAASVAVVGLANDQNLFVGADGTWRRDSYIPAYVRRYPFVFIRAQDADKLILAVDEAADSYAGEKPAQAFFEAGEPSASTKHALEFCVEFQRQYEIAQAFAQAAEAQGLLVEYRAELRARSGAHTTLSGFRVIDEAKFNALPDETFLDWRKRGFVALAYAHLMSMRRWEALAAVANEGEDA